MVRGCPFRKERECKVQDRALCMPQEQEPPCSGEFLELGGGRAHGQSPDPSAVLHPLLSCLPIYYVALSLTSFPTQPGSHIQCVNYTLLGTFTFWPLCLFEDLSAWETLHLGSNDLPAQEPSTVGKNKQTNKQPQSKEQLSLQ